MPPAASWTATSSSRDCSPSAPTTPAIDVLDSVSRTADDVSDAAHIAARRQVVKLLAAYRKVEDLVQIGAYARGSSPESDVAILFQPRFLEILRQDPGEHEQFEKARGRLIKGGG
jgi:flagellum-specific ATP synthase